MVFAMIVVEMLLPFRSALNLAEEVACCSKCCLKAYISG